MWGVNKKVWAVPNTSLIRVFGVFLVNLLIINGKLEAPPGFEPYGGTNRANKYNKLWPVIFDYRHNTDTNKEELNDKTDKNLLLLLFL